MAEPEERRPGRSAHASARPSGDRPSTLGSLSPIGLGCYAIGGGYAGSEMSAARAVVDRALDAGWTLLDTAESYLDSEVRLGEILAGRRDRVLLATKAFPCERYTSGNLEAAVEQSLRRLRTDRIDLFQLHAPEDWVRSLERTPFDDIAQSLDRLIASGKVLAVGVCNFPLDDLQALQRSLPLHAIQNLYSLLDRGHDADDLHLPVETELLPWAQQNDVAVIVYSPLSRGLLGGKLDPKRIFGTTDERHLFPRFQPDTYPHYAALADRLGDWARDHGRTLPQLAVAWTLHHPAVSSALVGARSAEQLDEVIGADDWHLTATDIAEIDEIVATLPDAARRAKMIYLDHVTPEALAGMRERRHAAPD